MKVAIHGPRAIYLLSETAVPSPKAHVSETQDSRCFQVQIPDLGYSKPKQTLDILAWIGSVAAEGHTCLGGCPLRMCHGVPCFENLQLFKNSAYKFDFLLAYLFTRKCDFDFFSLLAPDPCSLSQLSITGKVVARQNSHCVMPEITTGSLCCVGLFCGWGKGLVCLRQTVLDLQIQL